MPTKILIKRGSASQWSSSTTALSSGELGLDTTNNIIKVGDGSTLWNSLPGLTLTLTQVAELAQDALSTAFSNGTHSNITVTYNDNTNSISLATGPDVITTTSLNNTLTDPSSGYVSIGDVGVADGVASLGPDGKIPDSEIPAGIARDTEVSTAIANLVNSAPSTLDTLNELATALGNDANFSTTVTNSIAGKVSKSGGDTITASTASTVGLIVKAATSQTADIQRWQDSGGNTIAKIGPLYGSNVFQFDPFSYGAGSGYSQIMIGGRSITNEQRAAQSKFGVTTGEWALGALRATDNQVGAFAVSTTLPTFVVKGAASQTANLLEFQDSSGTVVGKYNTSYQMTVGSLQAAVGDVQARYGIYGGGTGYLGALSIVSWAANVPTAVLRGYASQTANLQEWQNSAGNVLTKIASDGTIVSYGSSLNAFQSIGTSTTLYNGITVQNSTGASAFSLGTAGTSESTFSVANSFYIYDGIAGVMRLRLNSSGLVGINAVPTSQLQVNNSTAANVGLIVKGAESQTANLQEWQNSSGTVLTRVNNNGNIIVGSSYISNSDVSAYGRLQIQDGGTNQTILYPMSAGFLIQNLGVTGMTILKIRGASGQTASLQEWQDSTGAVLSSVDFGGAIKARYFSNRENSSNAYIDWSTDTLNVTNRIASSVPFSIKSVASQTANLQEWQNSAGTVLASIDPNGQLRTPQILNVASFNNSRLQMTNTGSLFDVGVASNVALRVRGAASQTANLQEWQNSSGTVLARVGSGGAIVTSGVGVFGSQSNTPNAQLYVLSNNTSNPALVVEGASGQTSTNIFEVQRAGGGDASFRVSHNYIDLVRNTTAAASMTVYGPNAGAVPLYVKGRASQTADLQQWQDSSGTVLAQIDAAGNSVFNNISTTNNINAYYGKISANTQGSGFLGQISAIATSASTIGMVIRGAASQTANLQEWQDSSGTVLSSVTANGRIFAQLTSELYGTIQSKPYTSGAHAIYAQGLGSTAAVRIDTVSASAVGLMIKGATSQTANLTEWQNSSGIAYTYIGSPITTGQGPSIPIVFSSDGVGQIKWGNNTVWSIGLISGQTNVMYPYSNGRTALIIQGLASQTANLQEWQNSSGTVLVKLTAEGVLDTPLITNAQAASYTLVAADSGKLVEINNASGVTLTIPTNASVSYAIGTQINILQTGTGQITIAGAGGVTVNATPGLKLRAQWSSATLIKRGTDTWVAIGDLSV